MSQLLAGLLARGGRLGDGWIDLDGERVRASAHGPPPRTPDRRFDGVLAPGLLDLQVNGAGGHEATGGGAALDAIDAVQLAHGVTGYLPTLVSPDDATAERVLPALAQRADDPSSPIAGAHVEGPFLDPRHAGMHPPERLRAPADGVPDWLESPAVRMVTLAPELPGALALIERLAARGICVSLGHSGADAATVATAIDAGASAVTHVFNAMGALHHRMPGLAGAALVEDRVRIGVIADGLHVDPLVLELVRRAAGPRTMLVSDSGPAAAAGGSFEMAGVAIELTKAGEARTAQGTLAGSAMTLDVAVRNWCSLTGATLAEAVRAATEVPAALIGLPVPLGPGSPADLLLLSEDGAVQRVMRRGAWLPASGRGSRR